MDIYAEQTDLCHYAEAHQQRIDHLRARIDRSTRELRVHEMIRDLAANTLPPNALRNLATADDFSVVATNRDDWFPAHLSWSSSEGFNGRITNNSWRVLQPAAPAEDA